MKRTILALTLTALMLACLGTLAYAQVGGGFDLKWSVVAGGGATYNTGGTYSLGATAGQPVTGASSGGAYSLQSGFWSIPGRTATPVSTATATSTSTATATATSQPVLVAHVMWQGRAAQPSASQQLPVTVTLKSAAGEFNFPAQMTDANGNASFNIGTLPTGAYLWRAQGPKYLANAGSITLTGTSTSVEIGQMRVGDANNDNTISAADFNILKATFGKTQGDAGYDPRADFNGDDTVGASDFNLLKANFGTSGAPPL